MDIKVNGTVSLSVSVDPKEVLEELKSRFGFKESRGICMMIKDYKLYRREDISRHGSPLYEDTLISENPEDIEALKALDVLMKYLEVHRI